MNRPITIDSKTYFPSEAFFRDLKNGDLFRTKRNNTVQTKDETVFYPSMMPVLRLTSY